MDFNNPSTIEEVVIAELSRSNRTAEVLLKIAQLHKTGFTKQALYLVLRKLMEKEIVIKHGKLFSLSQPWLRKMSLFFSIAEKQYGNTGESNEILRLSDGDKILYSFKNAEEADKFWAHAFHVFGTFLAGKEPIYMYNPHEWFFFARKESEEFMFTEAKKRNQKIWLIAAGVSILDKYIGKYFDGSTLQYYMTEEVLFEARNYYLNIFGDYIIEARIDEKVAEKVDEFYKIHTRVTDETTKLLTSLLTQGKTTITITRNKKKADKLKKVFKHYFY